MYFKTSENFWEEISNVSVNCRPTNYSLQFCVFLKFRKFIR